MRSTRLIRLTCLLAVVDLAGCDRIQRTSTAPVAQRPTGLVATLSATNPAASGDDVTVTARASLDGKPSATGSFVARLTYDPQALAFLGSAPIESGLQAMHVSNPGVIRAAGANLQGAGNETGVLFRVRFRVLRPGGLESLVLAFDEMNDASRRSRLTALTVARTVSTER